MVKSGRLLHASSWKELMKQHQNSEEPKGTSYQGVLKTMTAVSSENEDRVVEFVISTGDLDRDFDRVDVSGWDFKNWLSNPVVLFAHDIWSPPVAKGLSITKKVEDKEKGIGTVTSKVEFASPDVYEFADTIYRLYKGKFMNSVSVGFMPVEWSFVEDKDRPFGIDFHKQELLEFSTVPVPSNPNALQRAKSLGIDLGPLAGWAEERSKTLKGNGCDEQAKFTDLLYDLCKSTTTYSTPTEEVFTTVAAETKSPTEERGDETESPEETTVSKTEEQERKMKLTFAEYQEGLPVKPKDYQRSSKCKTTLKDGCFMDGETGEIYLIHHDPAADHAVVFRDVVSCMKELMSNTELELETKRKCYDHLASHYREDFDTEPPDFKYVENSALYHFKDVMTISPEDGQVYGMDVEDKILDILKSCRDQLAGIKTKKSAILKCNIEGIDKMISDIEEGMEHGVGAAPGKSGDNEETSSSEETPENEILFDGFDSVDAVKKAIQEQLEEHFASLGIEATGRVQ